MSSAPTNVVIHLYFEFPDEDVLPHDDELWMNDPFELSQDATVTELEEQVKLQIAMNLKADHAMLLRTVEASDSVVSWFFSGAVSVVGQPPGHRSKNNLRVRHISDFFMRPHLPNSALNVTVGLAIAARPPLATRQPERKISNLSLALNSNDRVVHARELDPGFDAYKYIFARFGNVSATESPNSTAEDDTVMDRAPEVPNSTLVPHVQALIGYYVEGIESSSGKMSIATVPAWDYGDYSIGDCMHEDEPQEFNAEDDYLLPYAGVTCRSDLHKRLQRRRKRQEEDPNPGVPFMPYYTHNRYDPSTFGTGVDDPNAHADVVIVFSDKLSHVGLTLQPQLSLPDNVQYRLGAEETVGSICELLLEDLANKTIWHNWVNAHTVLFAPPHEGTWELQLWVLPQPKQVRTMYKFPTGREGSTDRLGEFLSPDKVEAKDHHLYVEAHLVTKPWWEESRAATREEELGKVLR